MPISVAGGTPPTGFGSDFVHNAADHLASGAADLIGAVGGLPKLVRRTTDSTAITASVTLTSDDTLLWAIGASEVWFFEGFLIFSGVNTTHDARVGIAGPSGATASWGLTALASGVGGYHGVATGSTGQAIQTISGAQTFGSLNGSFGQGIAGVVVNSTTAGNVNIQWAQGTSDAGELKLLTNSFIRVTRLA